MFKLIKSLLLILVLAFFFSCEDRTDLAEPEAPNLGSADFSRFFTLGNSLTSGYQNGSLYESAQDYSIGNQISRQVRMSDFAQPTVSGSGAGARVELQGFNENGDPILVKNMNYGPPTNLNYAGVYNNLGIPGAMLYDVLNATNQNNCASALFAATPNPYFDLVLRNQGSQFSQLKMANPTILNLWIGNNDILGHALHGGTIMYTPISQFNGLYNNLADSVATLGCDVFVANIPDVTSIAYFTALNKKISDKLELAASANQYIQGIYVGKFDGTTTNATPYNYEDVDSMKVLFLLEGSEHLAHLGEPGYQEQYKNSDGSYSIPEGVNVSSAFGFTPSNPFPDHLALDAIEISNIKETVLGYNNKISEICEEYGFTLVDVNALMNDVSDGGYLMNGINYTQDFITGNLFSLDGVHPTSRGYGVVANEFIKKYNEKFNAEIPLINTALIPGSIPLAE
ncbi:MAG: hypothetical protein JXR48_12935 [Candidatus Delongbacteria bacterium]|nr:hypothetical protein [Candidatus Delongbacteria bacterium]MBN2835858.1 hypothetical protein [Candidatus Delongbacteria bacterium]